MNLTTYNFNGAPVRTVTLPNGEPGFVGKDVAERLGYEDPTTAIRSHCRGVQILHPIPDSLGRMQQTRILTEPDVLRLIVSSTLPEAEAFERWVFEEVLPSIRKTGAYTMHPPAQAHDVTALQLALVSAQMSADILRLEGSARLGMLRQAHELAGAGHLLPMLPAYAIDAPSDAPAASSEVTASLTELLRKNGVKMSAFAANKRLAELGFIAPEVRSTSNGGTRGFWSVTPAGRAYGKNVTSASSPRETQPHWYVSKFDLLLAKIRNA